MDGLNEINSHDGDAEAGTGGDGAWDGDAADAGRAKSSEEGKGGGEEGLGTHDGLWKEVAWRRRRVDGVQERIRGWVVVSMLGNWPWRAFINEVKGL